MTSLSTNSLLIGEIESRSGNSGSKFRGGDTLFARITPCLENGKTGYVNFLTASQVGFGSTEFVIMRGRTVSPEWVYLFARTEEFRGHAIKSMSGASGRQRVRRESLEEFLLPIPDAGAVDKFTEIVRPMFDKIRVLDQTNRALRAARDLLVLKMVSGEIALPRTKLLAETAAQQAAAG